MTKYSATLAVASLIAAFVLAYTDHTGSGWFIAIAILAALFG